MQEQLNLELLAELKNIQIGEVMAHIGCKPEEIKQKRRYIRTLNEKPIRVICDWKWIEYNGDSLLTEKIVNSYQEMFNVSLKSPVSLIYSNCVLIDETNESLKGSWVRTTYLIDFHDNCVFETKNTNYLLVESGRKQVTDLTGLALLSRIN